jgi:hypothetical protein
VRPFLIHPAARSFQAVTKEFVSTASRDRMR